MEQEKEEIIEIENSLKFFFFKKYMFYKKIIFIKRPKLLVKSVSKNSLFEKRVIEVR